MAIALAFFEKLLSFFCTLFGLVLGLIIVLICLDVALRDLGLGSLPWLIELSEYLMYAGTFLAAPWVLRQGAAKKVPAYIRYSLSSISHGSEPSPKSRKATSMQINAMISPITRPNRIPKKPISFSKRRSAMVTGLVPLAYSLVK